MSPMDNQNNLGQKILVIGCPGSGKSTFSKALQKYVNIPIYHLDLYYHHKDHSITPKDEFDEIIYNLCQKEQWIIDGNYLRTLPMRIEFADTIFWLDYDQDVCVQSVLERVGKQRDDMPWVEETINPQFLEFVQNFHNAGNPIIEYQIRSAERLHKQIHRFKNRKEANCFLETLRVTDL